MGRGETGENSEACVGRFKDQVLVCPRFTAQNPVIGPPLTAKASGKCGIPVTQLVTKEGFGEHIALSRQPLERARGGQPRLVFL